MRGTLFLPLVLLGACAQDYAGITIEPFDPMYLGTVDEDSVEVPEGVALTATVELVDAENVDASLVDLELRGKDPNILEVRRGDFLGRFIFVGVTVGQTCVEVLIDDERKECIDAMVTSQ